MARPQARRRCGQAALHGVNRHDHAAAHVERHQTDNGLGAMSSREPEILSDARELAPRAASPLKRALMITAAAILLAAIALYFAPQFEDVRQLGRLSRGVLIGSIVLLFSSHLAQNESMLLPLRVHLPRLGFWELFLVRTGGLVLGSAVPVAGGVAVRLAYLTRQGLTYTDFATATLLSNVLALIAAACLALPATAVLWSMSGAPPTAALGLVLAVVVLGAAALRVLQSLPRLARHPRLARWLPAPDAASASRSLVLRVLLVSVLRHTGSFIAFGWLYSALSGIPGSFVAGGLVYALTTPVRMVNLTPANLGVNEWATAVVGGALAFDVTTGLLVSGVFRAASLAAQGAGVLVGSVLSGSGARPGSRP